MLPVHSLTTYHYPVHVKNAWEKYICGVPEPEARDVSGRELPRKDRKLVLPRQRTGGVRVPAQSKRNRRLRVRGVSGPEASGAERGTRAACHGRELPW